MNICPLWVVCLIVRLAIIYIVKRLEIYSTSIALILCIMGMGFMIKGFTGSNNETQICKVFWHDTRYTHGLLYLLSAYYLFNKKIDMARLLLLTDVFFSISYRIYTNQ